VGLFKKQKGMFSELRNLTASLDPQQLASMTDGLRNPAGMAGLTGSVDPGLMQNGLLGRGLILSIEKTGTSVGSRHEPRPVCLFRVEVTLDNTPSYVAEFRQSVPLADVPQYVPGHTFVAVRVDAADHSRVAMDRSQEPPMVTISDQTTGVPTAASVLETGNPVRAIVIQTQSLSARNPAGLELYAFVLTILEEGHPPRQVQAGNPVPASCIPLLYPGSNMPAKVHPGQPALVAIDWDEALTEASK
jgi:hypothetical protein